MKAPPTALDATPAPALPPSNSYRPIVGVPGVYIPPFRRTSEPVASVTELDPTVNTGTVRLGHSSGWDRWKKRLPSVGRPPTIHSPSPVPPFTRSRLGENLRKQADIPRDTTNKTGMKLRGSGPVRESKSADPTEAMRGSRSWKMKNSPGDIGRSNDSTLAVTSVNPGPDVQQPGREFANNGPVFGGLVTPPITRTGEVRQAGKNWYPTSTTTLTDKVQADTFIPQATGLGKPPMEVYPRTTSRQRSVSFEPVQMPSRIYQTPSANFVPPRLGSQNMQMPVVPSWMPARRPMSAPVNNPRLSPPPALDFRGVSQPSSPNRDVSVKAFRKENGFSPRQAVVAPKREHSEEYQCATERERCATGSRLRKWSSSLDISGSGLGSLHSSNASTKGTSSRNSVAGGEGSVKVPKNEWIWECLADTGWIEGPEKEEYYGVDFFPTVIVQKIGWQVDPPAKEGSE